MFLSSFLFSVLFFAGICSVDSVSNSLVNKSHESVYTMKLSVLIKQVYEIAFQSQRNLSTFVLKRDTREWSVAILILATYQILRIRKRVLETIACTDDPRKAIAID